MGGHDVDYLAVGGFPAMSYAGCGGAPRCPGAGGRRRGRRMHAALAITAALAGRARTGEGAYLDVSVADGVLWRCRCHRRTFGAGRRRPPARLLSGRTPATPPMRQRTASGWRWRHRGQVLRQPLPRSAATSWRPSSSTTGRRPHPGDVVAAFATGRDEWVRRWRAPTLVWRRCSRSRRWRPAFAAGGLVAGVAPDRGRLTQLAPLLAGMDRPARRRAAALPDMAQTDTGTS